MPNTWNSTKRLQLGPWYGEGDDDRRSCRRLEQCVTEFQAQGLELDAVLLAWGTDFVRTDGHWSDDDARRYQQPQRIRGAIISDDDLGAVETAVRRFEQGVLDDTDVVLHTADISRNRRSFERLSDPHERARFHAGVTAPFQARRTPPPLHGRRVRALRQRLIFTTTPRA